MGKIATLANPSFFMGLTDRVLPWLAAATLGLFGVGLYLSFFYAPPDYQQGETVRIMFIHVPSAWLAMFCYVTIAISAIGSLVWRHPLADVSAKAAAPIGAAFTLLALVTGSLWGKPMWGTFWVWDARLTSVLILFFLYLGYIALHDAFDEPARGGRAASILCLVGSVNLPIIKFSVDWWNTLHQPSSILRLDGPAIHPSMLWPLLVMWLAFLCYFVAVHILRTRAELTARKIRNLRLSADPAA
jgi:heme exporter protein C